MKGLNNWNHGIVGFRFLCLKNAMIHGERLITTKIHLELQ